MVNSSAFFDRPGLLGAWREALLAQKVLAGQTRGYVNHPQLARFRDTDNPGAAIGRFLSALADEGDRRGYNFDRGRIVLPNESCPRLLVTSEQLHYEWAHLMAKIEQRSPQHYLQIKDQSPQPHPLFRVVEGPIASWERLPQA